MLFIGSLLEFVAELFVDAIPDLIGHMLAGLWRAIRGEKEE